MPANSSETETVELKAEQVVAQVSPRSIGGTSLFSEQSVTPQNVDQFRSDPSDIAYTRRELQRLGFTVLQEADTTLSIAGPPKLFEEVFGVSLRKDKQEIRPGTTMEFYAAAGEDPYQQLLQPPGELANLIEGVAIARPPVLFESALPPLAPPDPAAYRYLLVPDEPAVVIRAARAHRLGATGQDVVVAMIDSGHYRHPYFVQHGYRLLDTLLGPGAADPANDTLGHGTGESANIFAAAPDCRLRPIKGLVDPTGDFNTAVASTPKPQVMSNSWGYDVDAPGAKLDPYLMTLEAAVSNAVAKGIAVCFSAGNGQMGFPGCMPQVISVGGVHVNYPNLNLEASSYASSFDSSLYPGRHVPDLCGLTGKKVSIGGQGRAPSHMLPVQPGSQLDAISPSTGAVNDGWGLFSGTSAACPLVAGVAALVLAKTPSKTPDEVKQILTKSATDVTAGTTFHGDSAGPGWDKATGSGLVDAKYAWIIAMGDVAAQFFAAPTEVQAEMLQSGSMPRLTQQFTEDVVDTLRSQ